MPSGDDGRADNAFSGNSGVGKSTLINDLIPGLDLRTAEISHTHDAGMHTTTFSEMFFLPGGRDAGAVIDTPGVRGFGTIDFDRHEVGHFFPEIFRSRPTAGSVTARIRTNRDALCLRLSEKTGFRHRGMARI